MDNELKELRFGIYNRKSSDSEDKQVQSIETQERENVEFAERRHLTCIPEAFYSETKSAFVPGRELFFKMTQDIESGKIDALIVIHPSRLARNPVDAGHIIYLMDLGKLKAIVTPSRVFFPTASDKFMLGLEFVISKKDSDDKSKAVKDGQKTKAINGTPHGVAAIGFLNNKTGEKGAKKWMVDPERFPLLELVFKRFLQRDISGSKLRLWANEQLKLTTPKHKKSGGKPIVHSRIFEILKDPIYAGFFFQNGQRYELDPTLPRIISEAEHHLILRLLGNRHASKAKTHTAVYTGFIKGPEGEFVGLDPKLQVICDCKRKFSCANKVECPHCHKELQKLEAPKYLIYNYYYNVRRKKQKLPTRHVVESDITTYLVDYIERNLQLSPDLADWSRKYIKELQDKELQEQSVIIEQQARRKHEVNSKRIKYRELLAEGVITAEEYREDMKRLDTASASSAFVESRNWFSRANEIIDLTQELIGVLQNGSVEAKRKVLGRLRSNLIWDEKELSIYNTKPIQILIEGLKEARAKIEQFEPENHSLDKGETEAFTSVRPIMLRG